MDRLWLLIPWITWLTYEDDVTHKHNGYTLDDKTTALMLLHNFISNFVAIGLVFSHRSDIILHACVLYALIVSRIAFDDCILSVFHKKWVNYSEEDLARIHQPETTHAFVIKLLPFLALDLLRLRTGLGIVGN